MKLKIIKLFLRLALSLSFLSAVADRFGLWPENISVWQNWSNFLDYTQLINPWLPHHVIPLIGVIVTVLEIAFAMFLLIGLKTEFFAKLSGFLLLIFALSMAFSTGIKGVLDFSVLSASAGAFALSQFKEKYIELDLLFSKASAELKT
ncbi:DoxX family protein [uncultured Psychroserpens sp.]|uniref:DoxX family protein n=1 Tax=uncultured Psychroserpens sp. TaxID=255436 RepID=UPI00263A04DA|nr:DoxX family protein [uncultured Psychroserpens sp.]